MSANNYVKPTIETISFSNATRTDRKMLKKFVAFHWKHYANDPQFIPLLDYEYLGLKLIGMTGFFEPKNLFFKHAEMRFFMAIQNGEIVGRCNAFVNHQHNKHWQDKVGFFGQFESIDNQVVTGLLIDAASQWLKSKGMEKIRGPQNLPVNEATPGLMTAGFDSRPVIYYHYNKPYYENLLQHAGFQPVKRVLSWELPVMSVAAEKLDEIAASILKKANVKMETWGERSLAERKQEMFEIYNSAWSDNFGFVPFTQEEFYTIVNDMQLIIDKNLFVFCYLNDQPIGFFGGVPNVTEHMAPSKVCKRCELLRAANMLLKKGQVRGFRLGYLGVKKEYRNLGLAAVMLWKQKGYAQQKKYEYCDLGWVLEDNYNVTRMVDMMGCEVSKIYTVFEKSIE